MLVLFGFPNDLKALFQTTKFTSCWVNQPRAFAWGFFIGRIPSFCLLSLLFGFWCDWCSSLTIPVTIDSVLVALRTHRGFLNECLNEFRWLNVCASVSGAVWRGTTLSCLPLWIWTSPRASFSLSAEGWSSSLVLAFCLRTISFLYLCFWWFRFFGYQCSLHCP